MHSSGVSKKQASRNKLELLVDQAKLNVDVLNISETKLNDSFSSGQFKFEILPLFA